MLRRRGDLTFWIDEAALAGWQAQRPTTPGGQPHYSDLAVELVLTLRLVFHLALRQTEAFSRSVLALLGLDLAVPDHTTLSRRGRAFAGRQSRVTSQDGPVHLMLDSTDLQLFGQGEWHAAKHSRTRRKWRKLHLAVDTTTSEVAAHVLTEGRRRALRRLSISYADGTLAYSAQASSLLRQVEGAIVTLSADGAYDSDAVYRAAASRQQGPLPHVLIPPRTSAVLSTDDPAAQTPRHRQIRLIVERGRMGWQQATGYGRHSLVEITVGRYKHVIGPKLRARTLPGQQGEAAVAVLNRIIRTAKPVSVRQT